MPKRWGKTATPRHLKFEAVHKANSGNPLKAIAFNMGEHYDKMKQGKTFSLCYHLDENSRLGNTSLKLQMKDIRFEE